MNIGLVGVGGMGSVHYANYKEIEGCQVAAVCGGSKRAKETAEKWGLPCYPSIREMVENCDIDIVDICTPTYLHHDMVMESLDCGKDTICEKPIALSLKDAKEMLDKAEQKDCMLYIAQVLQFTKEVEILRRTVESGVYGKPLDACFERLSACPRWAQDGWLFDVNKSGLLPYDLHIHDLDVIVSIFGKPEGYSFTSCQGEDKDYPEQFRISYDYGKFHVAAEAAWFNADIPWTARWRVYFENGMLINDGSTLTAYQFGSEPKVFDTSDQVMVSTGINVPPCGWYYNELKHFLDCAREHRPSPNVGAGQLLTVMEILEDISAKWRK
ncbi:MAG TPA: Gfo/Idh/MocA family oxidoreductase [Candidatus Limivicinus faecipullorum]|nr:Gfo/Idh/MocA family oxidoreductase [Candidatus Limivicinus faecipullorum]